MGFVIPRAMDHEAGLAANPIMRESWRSVLILAYQSLGVVYGDLSTSPLYVYRRTFAEDILLSGSNDEIYGVLSFVFWTLTLVALLKYIVIVLRADDNGEGGTFALYSLLCRHTRIGFLPSGQLADEKLSAYKERGGKFRCRGDSVKAADRVKRMLEKHPVLHRLLLIITLIGASMIIGDSVLTPAISVFSAVSGVELSLSKEDHKCYYLNPQFQYSRGFSVHTEIMKGLKEVIKTLEPDIRSQNLAMEQIEIFRYKQGSFSTENASTSFKTIQPAVEVPLACVILVCLFVLQHYGTHRVGFLFAPIIITWLLCISMIGVYNIFYWNPHVYQAIYPYYMYKFLKKTKRRGWMSLGGILLCVTGSETMFADLGHFSRLSVKIAFTCVVYPSLLLAYMGQAAYLSTHQFDASDYRIGFYVSVPVSIRWPVFAIAILAAVVGSQAVITSTFSIIKQCSALGCFPRVKIVHTSSTIHGQVYIPEINWILMILCLAVTVGFSDIKHLGNASGLAVITGMLVTTCLMSLVIVLCWQKSIFLAMCFFLFFGTIEVLYFSAALNEFSEGAWVPIALSFIITIVMYVWRYGTVKKYEFDVQNKVSVDWLLSLTPSLGIVRVHGIGLIHTELVSGIPAIFSHFITNLPAFHQVLIIFCTKSVPVPYVQPEEQFLVGRIGPKEYRIYRCIVRYGYHDVRKDDLEFEKELVCSIAEFIQSEISMPNGAVEESENNDGERMAVIGAGVQLYEEDTDPEEAAGPLNLRGLTSPVIAPRKRVRFLLPPESPKLDSGAQAELEALVEAREGGMVFILGNSYVRAKSGSGWIKRLAIDYCYDFLRRNSRGPTYTVTIPHASTLEVGMVYDI